MNIDHKIIFDLIEREAKVLDLGAGAGDLLSLLINKKNIKAQGIEINEELIYKCVEKGVSVFHNDFESGLSGFPDNLFDYVILNNSMQEAKKLNFVLQESMRIGKKVIVGFPNFAHIYARARLFFKGKVPITKSLPYSWSDTPNLRFLSIADFKDYCNQKNIQIVKSIYFGKAKVIKLLPNVLSYGAIFVISADN